ncbi:MAG: alpha/beta hydrolase [bacterium]|nr:alpha/beta hydrolase [bacterium]
MIYLYKHRQIYYRVKGSGIPLVFLHGLPLDSDIWEPVIEKLSVYFQCISLDFPGFGRSKSEHDLSISFNDHKEIVHSLLKLLKIESCILLGHSFGGYVCLDFVSNYPSFIKQLILVSTKATEDSDIKKSERLFFSQELMRGRYTQYLSLQLESCLSGGMYDALIKKNIEANVDYHIAKILESLTKRKSYMSELKKLRIPVNIVVGKRDEAFLSEAFAMYRAIPDAKIEVIPEAKHMVFLDNLEYFVSLIKGYVAYEPDAVLMKKEIWDKT